MISVSATLKYDNTGTHVGANIVKW